LEDAAAILFFFALLAFPAPAAYRAVTNSASAKTQTWRVSKAQEPLIVAFSPNGAKLAGTVWQPSGASIVIWAVPK